MFIPFWVPMKLADKKALTRAKITRAALELFAARGYHGTSVPAVAERANVGAGTIYRYFDSKEILVNEVFRQAKESMRGYLDEEFDLSRPPLELFREFWSRLADFAREHPVAFRFLEMQDHATYLDADSKAIELMVLAPIHAVCLHFQQVGALRSSIDPGTMMALAWGAFVGLMKAERLGYLIADERTILEAGEACWFGLASHSFPANHGDSA